MTRRNIVRIISFLSAFLVVATIFLAKSYQKNQKYKLQIENNYSRSLDEFSSAMNNISLILKKAEYATSANQLSRLASELLSEAEVSKSALSQLPTNNDLTALNRFLSQAGNYAMAVSNMLYNGESMPKDFGENITYLSKTAQKVSEAVNTAQINYNNIEYWAKELEDKIDSEVDQNLSASLNSLEGELSDYPTLIYDGPYSDHILEKEPLMLKNEAQITKEKANEIANDNVGQKVEFVAETGGKIPAYRFADEQVNISVSKAGGHIVYMRKNRNVGDNILSYEQALEKAKRYLSKMGKTNFIETYYFTDEGVCVINFAFLDGQTICYTDLLKVGVAMDTGEIMLYEASGYLTNHQERAFQTPVYTAEQARAVLSEKLVAKKTALALIPTSSGKEVRCYEFLCTSEETEEILVYINVLTLKEEEILILLKSDGGTLTK